MSENLGLYISIVQLRVLATLTAILYDKKILLEFVDMFYSGYFVMFFTVIFCDQKLEDETDSYIWDLIGNFKCSIVDTSDIFYWNILYSENCSEMDT